jgi:phosphate transport system substrate-binding protein
MRNLYLLVFLFILMSSCSSNENPFSYGNDTHSRGIMKLLVEDSFKPLFETSIYTFESQYPKAKISVKYDSEGEIIKAFFNDSVKTICISREFTKKEKEVLKSKRIEVRSDKIAEDAIALIIHPSNPDSLMTVKQIKDIILGKTTSWPDLKMKINIVFDKQNSANFNYLKKLCDLKGLPLNLFAVQSNEEVINYVKKNKSALGIIGLNWISDSDDFETLGFVDGINVVAVAKDNGSDYFKPYAGYIFTKEYPLSREIWLINKAKKSGLNTGFVLFMKGDKGQLIVQKSALVPASAPVRLIQLITE